MNEDNRGKEENSMTRLTMAIRTNTRLLRNAVMLGALGLLLLTACNTTAGFGRDMQSVGRNIQDSATKNNK
jgi:predicted small secreted protein